MAADYGACEAKNCGGLRKARSTIIDPKFLLEDEKMLPWEREGGRVVVQMVVIIRNFHL